MAKTRSGVGRLALSRGLITQAELASCLRMLGGAVDDQQLLELLLSRGLVTKKQAVSLQLECGGSPAPDQAKPRRPQFARAAAEESQNPADSLLAREPLQWVLTVNFPGGSSENYLLDPSRDVTIGRSLDCSIRLDDLLASRQHCRLSFFQGRWHVDDLGSYNGTLVNRDRVQSAPLASGDTISVGRSSLSLACVETPLASTIRKAAGRPPTAADTPPLTDDAAEQSIQDVASLRGATTRRRLLGKRYELGPLIHHGATGAFYRAQHVKTGRCVCVKLLAQGVTSNEQDLKRFVRGVKTASQLRHPNIVELYHAGCSKSQWWLAMEFVEGSSLRRLVSNYGVAGTLSPPRVLAIARDIVAALETAYERQVVHRNINLDSILLTSSGTAKLSNFTLARGVVLDTLNQITGAGQVVGDLTYMAPERTHSDCMVDCRADIYSLGVCMYVLLAGRAPFTGYAAPDLVRQIRTEEPAPPSRFNLGVPAPLEGVVLTCLAKSPTDRYQTPMHLRAELARAAQYQGLWV